ncbi:competence protein CoiA-like family [Bacillus sp. A116_S68]|nr:competence protein CoiA-like family [Bacillus sp. A116_S68]
MREALHVTEGTIEKMPDTITKEEVRNYRLLAEKNIYICPYCNSNLIVKHGEERGTYFSHKHFEACEESVLADVAEKKYSKQTARESKEHRAIVDIIYDELSVTTRYESDKEVDYGYKAKKHLNHFPDVLLKIGETELAISVVTNVKAKNDLDVAKSVKKRHNYFIEHGMEPIWFIDNKELSIERDKNAIVLWDAEAVTALTTNEDVKWQNAINTVAKDLSFFKPYNYKPSMDNLKIVVSSVYYLTSNESNITVSVRRFLKDRETKPYRAFLLGDAYDISFSKALVIENESLKLKDSEIEERNRTDFINGYHALKKEQDEKEKRKRDELEQNKSQLEVAQRKNREQLIEEKKRAYLTSKEGRPMTYPELTRLLKVRIGLTQKEQIELWTRYMPKVGLKNAQKVWGIVEENNVKSFDELRRLI